MRFFICDVDVFEFARSSVSMFLRSLFFSVIFTCKWSESDTLFREAAGEWCRFYPSVAWAQGDCDLATQGVNGSPLVDAEGSKLPTPKGARVFVGQLGAGMAALARAAEELELRVLRPTSISVSGLHTERQVKSTSCMCAAVQLETANAMADRCTHIWGPVSPY